MVYVIIIARFYLSIKYFHYVHLQGPELLHVLFLIFHLSIVLFTANMYGLCLLLLNIVARDSIPLPCITLLIITVYIYCVSCVLILLFPEDLVASKIMTEHLHLSFFKLKYGVQQYYSIFIFSLYCGFRHSFHLNAWYYPPAGRLCLQTQFNITTHLLN